MVPLSITLTYCADMRILEEPGDEINVSYGSHSNDFLLVECE